MNTNRRDFIRTAAAAGGGLALGVGGRAGDAAALALTGGRYEANPGTPTQPTSHTGSGRSIRLLILGGTGFIGPHQVRYAVERGHQVTIFNRGRSAPGVFDGVEELTGDRAANDYASLRGRTWDAVIDNSAATATAPQWVREAGAALKDSVGQYLFISTRSVYRDLSAVPATVNAPLLTPETTPNWSEGQPYPYGLAKALAEGEALRAFGDRTTIVRPGLIVGPGDQTDRFTYWPVRIARGGEILVPGDGTDRIQIIDVRDLCEWCVRLCEATTFGTFMGVGPLNGRSMAEMVHGIAAVTIEPLSWTWVPAAFLAQHRVRPYAEMPVWRPSTQPGFEGFARFDLSREVAAGLTFRTLADTAQATLDFHRSRPAERQAELRAGLSAERESEVLRAWHASR
jgi:2'-hydroxyisoflavone reductase